MEKHTE